MKVFKSEIDSEYCYGGGVIIVAAHTAQEALETAAKYSKNESKFKYRDYSTNENIIRLDNDMKPFEEIIGLNCKTRKSKIICECIYFE